MRLGRLALGTLIAFAVAGATVAVAQPRHGRHETKPPARPAVEASTDESSSAGALKEEADAGPVPAPMTAQGGDDGGIRPSPLNPAPNEMPGYAVVDAGNVDYDRLLGDIAALRARVAAVGENLFHSRVALYIETDGSHAKIGKLTVAIDDGVVYSAPGGAFHADDMTPIYEHSVAPGRHAITVDVARRDDRNDAFRNEQKSRFTVDVPRDEELTVEIEVDDYSGMGDDFPSDKKGKYDFRVKVKAVSKAQKK
ncbi:MAG: hypothetical protein ACRELY_31820 [Polyangiaceae bacterium]